ncbi:MAG: glycosyltransferase [Solirubrobacteraceae bacterium]
MALRLTKTTLEPADIADNSPLAVHQAETAVVSALVARALPLLQDGDPRAYLELFTQAAALENPQRRYQAQKALLEQGLVSIADLSDARAAETLVAMAHGAIGALEREPAEPVLLGYAGVVLYELWALEGAYALFQAAARLDGELPHIKRNMDALRSRARGGANRKLAGHPVLVALTRRAKRVAQRARPATGMRLSLCMIVRDEEEMLPRSLAAAKDAVDEIIVVDTGSQDRTVEIAQSFGATVIQREWTGSFSDARNASLEAASGDWFMYLDADEVLIAEDIPRLRTLLGQTWREAFYLHETNFTGNEGDGVAIAHSALRVMRNRPQYRFSGRLHEQIAWHLPAYLPERIVQSPVRVSHYGYLGVVRESKDKSRRNIELLLAQQRDGQTDAFFHYNLGSEYFAVGEINKALAEYERSASLLAEDDAIHEFVPSLTVRWVRVLRATGHNEEALSKARSGLERFPGFTDLVYEQAMASLSLDRQEDAVAYLQQAIRMGDAPSKYTALLGAGTFMPRIALATMHLNRRESGEALELLQWCVDNHPEHLGTIHPYAVALLQSGKPAEEVAATLQTALEPMTAAGRFMLGTALFEHGHAAVAEQQFQCVLDRQPHSAAARAALAESLMYQRRYQEAAQTAAAIPDDTSLAVASRRTELFALLLAGDLAGTEPTLARASQAGMPYHELLLFRRWLARQRGQQHTPAPTASLPLLARMLESLLRVHDFANFESLLPLLEETDLPERERRELLAGMYLRRGFLRSAGREWMAVCKIQPDVRALVGLAQVALRNGQSQTSVEFAKQALSLDPGNEAAQRLAAFQTQAAGNPAAARENSKELPADGSAQPLPHSAQQQVAV